MVQPSRRRYLRGIGAAATVGLAGCLGGGGETSLTTVLPEGTVYYPWGQAAMDQGFFEEEGIDIEIQYRPFGAYVQSLSGGDVDISLRSLIPSISNINEGADYVTFGWAGGLQGINGMYSLAENDYDGIADLEGERIGVFSWGSSSVQSFQGLIANKTGLRLREDFETTTAAPPALQGLLDEGEIQAAIEVSSLTIAMESQPDQYQRMGQLNELWQEETGHNLALTSWFTRSDWLADNGDVATGLVEASRNATQYWRDNTRDILEEYGEPAAIDNEAKIDVVDRWTDDGAVFAGDIDQGYVDAAWQYLELMNEYGFIEDVPSQDDIVQEP